MLLAWGPCRDEGLWIDFQKSNCVLPSAEFSAVLFPDAAWRCCASEVKDYQESQRIKMWAFSSIDSEVPIYSFFSFSSRWELGRMGLRRCFASWVLNWPSGVMAAGTCRGKVKLSRPFLWWQSKSLITGNKEKDFFLFFRNLKRWLKVTLAVSYQNGP